MAQTRIYVVMQKDKANRLVEATSAAQAIRHCVRGEYSARIAGTKEIVAMHRLGVQVEIANETNEPTTTQEGDNNGNAK